MPEDPGVKQRPEEPAPVAAALAHSGSTETFDSRCLENSETREILETSIWQLMCRNGGPDAQGQSWHVRLSHRQ
jgi:hypothetical protein